MNPIDERSAGEVSSGVKLRLVVLLTVVLAALVVGHVTGINGSSYHLWPWQRIEALRVYPALLGAAAPALVALWQFGRRRWSARVLLPMLALSMLLGQLWVAGMQTEPFDLRHIENIVREPLTTSYFSDAEILHLHGGSLRGFLTEYPQLMGRFHLHSRQKPPGPILYYWMWLKFMPDARGAAFAGGVALGVISSLGVFAAYGLGKVVTRSDDAALLAAAWLALMPATTVFFPSFDACYPILACSMCGSWLLCVRTGQAGWTILFSVAVIVAQFFSFSLLVLGAVLGGWTLIEIARDGRVAAIRATRGAALSIGLIGAVYLIVWLTTGFNLTATFVSALRNQAELEASFVIPRPYPQTIPSDVQDFFLGSGWISLLLILFWLTRREWQPHVVVGLISIAIVAATGLLAVETSRVWLFLQPLALLPVGLELARWDARSRLVVFVCLVVLTAAVAQNMIFLAA